MANRAFLRVWTSDFSESTMIAQFARFLATAPLSASQNSFSGLTVQSVEAAETPVAEWDLRGQGFTAPEVAALAAQHLHSDTAYIASAQWDIWSFDIETLKWRHRPEPLELICHGVDYEGGMALDSGHLSADLGFEHFYTGHAGLLARGPLQIRSTTRIIRSSTHFANGCPRARISRNITRRRAKTSNNCSTGLNPSSARCRFSEASCGRKERRILRPEWMRFWANARPGRAGTHFSSGSFPDDAQQLELLGCEFEWAWRYG